MARFASATVSADMTRCPLARMEARAAASPSINAATKALDSIYRLADPPSTTAEERARRRGLLAGVALCFFTFAVDQRGCRARRQVYLGATFERIAILNRRSDYTRGDQLVELADPVSTTRRWGDKLCHDPPMGRDDYPLSSLDSPNVPAQIVP